MLIDQVNSANSQCNYPDYAEDGNALSYGSEMATILHGSIADSFQGNKEDTEKVPKHDKFLPVKGLELKSPFITEKPGKGRFPLSLCRAKQVFRYDEILCCQLHECRVQKWSSISILYPKIHPRIWT
jgi:hypothetical protein